MSNEGVGRANWVGTILLLLCPVAAIAGENGAIPDAASSLLSANAATNANSADYFVASPLASEHGRVIDRKFLILSAVSTAAIFGDSYTTTWIGNNYHSRGPGPCTVEGGEPQLYGLHPTVARAYAVGAVLSGGSIAVSFLAKKYLPSKMKWIWPGAFLYETSISVRGFSTNLARC